MKPLYIGTLLEPSPNFGQNFSKPAIVFLEMVGQIIPCVLHGISCPTISQKSRTGYAPPTRCFHHFLTNYLSKIYVLFFFDFQN